MAAVEPWLTSVPEVPERTFTILMPRPFGRVALDELRSGRRMHLDGRNRIGGGKIGDEHLVKVVPPSGET